MTCPKCPIVACPKCGTVLTDRQVAFGTRHCSRACAARGNTNARRTETTEVLALFRATRGQWLTLSDIAFWRYGLDDRNAIHAAQMSVYHLRKRGHILEARRFQVKPYAQQWVHGYRLIEEPASMEGAA